MLNETWRQYETPVIKYSTIESEGYGAYGLWLIGHILILFVCAELSVKEIRPPRMDDSGRVKYPVLFRV